MNNIDKKDAAPYADEESSCVESCDCQGICTCEEPGIVFDDEQGGCSDCSCDDDQDDKDPA